MRPSSSRGSSHQHGPTGSAGASESNPQASSSSDTQAQSADTSVQYNFVPVPQVLEGRDRIEYILNIREQPVQSRMCGSGEKADRRPVDPAPIVQLRVITHEMPRPGAPTGVPPHATAAAANLPAGVQAPRRANTMPLATHKIDSGVPVTTAWGPGWEDKAWYLENPYYFMYAMLADADTDAELLVLPDGRTRSTTGSCVSCLYHLKDVKDNSDQGFFVFPDLSIRSEGRYRLKLSLFETIGNEVHHCKSIYTSPFTVHSAKGFPGMNESTVLARSFASQGLKLRVRKNPRGRRGRTATNQTTYESEEDDATTSGRRSTKRIRSESHATHQQYTPGMGPSTAYHMPAPQQPSADAWDQHQGQAGHWKGKGRDTGYGNETGPEAGSGYPPPPPSSQYVQQPPHHHAPHGGPPYQSAQYQQGPPGTYPHDGLDAPTSRHYYGPSGSGPAPSGSGTYTSAPGPGASHQGSRAPSTSPYLDPRLAAPQHPSHESGSLATSTGPSPVQSHQHAYSHQAHSQPPPHFQHQYGSSGRPAASVRDRSSSGGLALSGQHLPPPPPPPPASSLGTGAHYGERSRMASSASGAASSDRVTLPPLWSLTQSTQSGGPGTGGGRVNTPSSRHYGPGGDPTSMSAPGTAHGIGPPSPEIGRPSTQSSYFSGGAGPGPSSNPTQHSPYNPPGHQPGDSGGPGPSSAPPTAYSATHGLGIGTGAPSQGPSHSSSVVPFALSRPSSSAGGLSSGVRSDMRPPAIIPASHSQQTSPSRERLGASRNGGAGYMPPPPPVPSGPSSGSSHSIHSHQLHQGHHSSQPSSSSHLAHSHHYHHHQSSHSHQHHSSHPHSHSHSQSQSSVGTITERGTGTGTGTMSGTVSPRLPLPHPMPTPASSTSPATGYGWQLSGSSGPQPLPGPGSHHAPASQHAQHGSHAHHYTSSSSSSNSHHHQHHHHQQQAHHYQPPTHHYGSPHEDVHSHYAGREVRDRERDRDRERERDRDRERDRGGRGGEPAEWGPPGGPSSGAGAGSYGSSPYGGGGHQHMPPPPPAHHAHHGGPSGPLGVGGGGPHPPPPPPPPGSGPYGSHHYPHGRGGYEQAMDVDEEAESRRRARTRGDNEYARRR